MRVRRVPAAILAVAVIAAAYGWAVLALTPNRPGTIGLNLNALGTDWMVFWSGPRWFFDGRLDALLDGERFTAGLNAAFAGWLSQPLAFRPWVYPPSYLLAMLPFGALPFLLSYAVFQLVTAGFLAAAVCATGLSQHRLVLLAGALLGPAAAVTAGMGQNAFLTASLLVGGFSLLPARRFLAGVLLGLVTMKPQFWLLVPVALVARREWRALAWSIASAIGLAAASAALFGIDCWRQWFDLARLG